MEEAKQFQFEGWAVVEIMGHQSAAGLVSTRFIGSAGFLEIVTPAVEPTIVTLDRAAQIGYQHLPAGSKIEVSRPASECLVGTGSVYRIRRIDEEDLQKYAPLTKKIIEVAPMPAIEAPSEIEEEEEEEDDEEVAF